MTTLTEQPAARRITLPGTAQVDADVDQACRVLHLPTVRERYEEVAEDATRARRSYKEFLADLLQAECEDRDQRRRTRLVREAGFPRPKRLDDFDFAANPNVTPGLIGTLAGGQWVAEGRPLCLLGDSGTGKSHLLIGIGTAVAETGLRVRYTTTANLVNELVEASDDKRLGKTIARYAKVDLLCLDEFGYLDLDRAGAKLLFQIFTEREERRAIAIATNAPFSEWNHTFADKRLCAAIVDRMTFNAHLIDTGDQSYRLASTTARTQD